jgi:hypothetical protein
VRIERPWAAQGDNFEILVPEAEDLEAALDRIRDAPVNPEAAQRYIAKRYAAMSSVRGYIAQWPD